MSDYPSGSKRFVHYEVADRPLIGGMGIVYFGIDLKEDRPVALKTFKPEYLPDRAARDQFLRECTAWVDLGQHPNIVRCYRVENVGLDTFLILELIAKAQGREGASLRDWILPGRPLPVALALLFALQIARGMKHATKNIPGFVHRDLKPENILVGADKLPKTNINRVRVTDFGLAHVMNSQAFRASQQMNPVDGKIYPGRTQLSNNTVGTPLYMAPEQWRNETVGVFTDVYALGCILYEMLTGNPAVDTDCMSNIAEIAEAHCQGHLGSLPDGVQPFLIKMLPFFTATDPRQRYSDWDSVEAMLSKVYTRLTGAQAPFIDLEGMSTAERLSDGWSYRAIGEAYQNIGKTEVALHYYEQALAIGQAEGADGLTGAVLFNLGNAYAALDNTQRATRYYEQVLAILRKANKRHGERANDAELNVLGFAYENEDTGNAPRAIGYLEQALVIIHEAGERRGEVVALNILGYAYADMNDLQGVIKYNEQALAIVREIGERHEEAMILGNLGNAYMYIDARQSIEYYEQALAITREIGDRRTEGTALAGLGATLLFRLVGEARQAIGYYKQVLAIDRETSDRRREATDLDTLGYAYAGLGEAQQAMGYYEQALAIFLEIGDQQGEGEVLHKLAGMYAEIGETRQAISYYKQVLAIDREAGRETGHRRMEAVDLNTLGIAYLKLGDTQRAIGYYEQALAIFHEIGDRQGEAFALSNLGEVIFLGKPGTVFTDLDNAPQAIGDFEQALTIARKTGDRRGEGNALNNLGIVYAALDQAQRAIEYYEQAVAIAREIGDLNGVATGSFILTLHYVQQGDAAHFLPLAQEAAQIFAQIGSPNTQREQELLTQLRGKIGDYEQALAIAQETGDRRKMAANLCNLGMEYDKLGDTQRAIEYYEQAVAIAREIGDQHIEGTILGNMGRAYGKLRTRASAQQAIECYEQAIAIAREIGDLDGVAVSSFNLALFYFRHNGITGRVRPLAQEAAQIWFQIGSPDAKMAQEWIAKVLGTEDQIRHKIEEFERALTIARGTDDRREEAETLYNLGESYRNLGDARRAIEYYEQNLAILRETGDRYGEAIVLGQLGGYHSELGDVPRAIRHYEQAVAIDRENGATFGVADNSFNLALLYVQQGEIARALPLAQKAAQIWSQIGDGGAQQAQELLTELSGKRNQIK